MENNKSKKQSTIILILSLAVLLAVILVSTRYYLRLDLSSDKVNTLSTISKNLYKELDEPVRLNYYISKSLATRHPGPRAIESLLKTLSAYSKGKIIVEIIDPTEPAKQEVAQSAGISPQQMEVFEKNERRQALVFSGITVGYLNNTQVIPTVISTETLEYDIVKAIRAAVKNKKPKVSVIIGDDEKTYANDFRAINQAFLESNWDISELKKSNPIDSTTDILFVLGNKNLDDYDTYIVDSWIANGGNVVFAVNSLNIINNQYMQEARPIGNNAILKALEKYGFKVEEKLVLDESAATIGFTTNGPSNTLALRYLKYNLWIMTRPENRSITNPLTVNMTGLDVFWANPITLLPTKDLTQEILVKTSKDSWLQDKNFMIDPYRALASKPANENEKKQYIVTALASGVFPQAYFGQQIPAKKDAEKLKALPQSSKAARILVVSSTDASTDLMANANAIFNSYFFVSAADYLSSGDDLLKIKARGQRDTRLEKIGEPKTKAALISFVYVLNLALIPFAILLFGILRAVLRKKLSKKEAVVRMNQSEAKTSTSNFK